MAFGAGKNGYLQVDDGAGSLQDLSAYCNKADIALTITMLDTTVFSLSAETVIPGLKGADKIGISGLLDPTLHTHFGTLYTNGGGLTSGNASVSWVLGPMGSTSGLPKFNGECFLSKYAPGAEVKGVVGWDVELTITGGVTVGTF